jgi:hypothetical protein
MDDRGEEDGGKLGRRDNEQCETEHKQRIGGHTDRTEMTAETVTVGS